MVEAGLSLAPTIPTGAIYLELPVWISRFLFVRLEEQEDADYWRARRAATAQMVGRG